VKLPVKQQGEAIFTEEKLARALGALALPTFEYRQRRWRLLTGESMNLSSELSPHSRRSGFGLYLSIQHLRLASCRSNRNKVQNHWSGPILGWPQVAALTCISRSRRLSE